MAYFLSFDFYYSSYACATRMVAVPLNLTFDRTAGRRTVCTVLIPISPFPYSIVAPPSIHMMIVNDSGEKFNSASPFMISRNTLKCLHVTNSA